MRKVSFLTASPGNVTAFSSRHEYGWNEYLGDTYETIKSRSICNLKGSYKKCLIHFAAMGDCTELLQSLLGLGAPFSYRDQNKRTCKTRKCAKSIEIPLRMRMRLPRSTSGQVKARNIFIKLSTVIVGLKAPAAQIVVRNLSRPKAARIRGPRKPHSKLRMMVYMREDLGFACIVPHGPQIGSSLLRNG